MFACVLNHHKYGDQAWNVEDFGITVGLRQHVRTLYLCASTSYMEQSVVNRATGPSVWIGRDILDDVAKAEKNWGTDLTFASTFSSRDFPLGTGAHKVVRDKSGNVVTLDGEPKFEIFGSGFVNMGLDLNRPRSGY